MIFNLFYKRLKDSGISFILLIFLSFFSHPNCLKAQDTKPDYDEISVLVQLENHGTFYTNALYSSDNKLFIPAEELFENLRIPFVRSAGSEKLEGFINAEDNRYSIDPSTNEVSYNKSIIKAGSGMVSNMGFIYLETAIYEKVFGLHLNFNFRSLSVSVKSDFELPVIKEKRLEEMRNKINKARGVEPPADTVLKREYHAFRFGMLDWYLMANQIQKHSGDIQAGIGLGGELLGGETNVFLNYSDKYKFDSRMQNYMWRWVDNSKKLVRQIQVGKVAPQTISSLYYPVIGASISNTPTITRRAVGEYTLRDFTQPDWLVELYINNELVDFTRADASGLFVFRVPLVYGFTTLNLRFYGPLGEERTETRTINIPYNFMPKGELEYKVGAGVLQNNKYSPIGRAETAYGLSRNITIGAGVEYMATITSQPAIPFLKASFLPASKLIITGEYDYGVRLRGTVNYYPFTAALLELDYIKYDKNQKAILYNYMEERKASLSLPLRFRSIAGFTRFGYKQNVYSNFNYNIAEVLVSGYYRMFNANISTYANWVGGKSLYINSMAALSLRMKYGFTFRSTAQFNLSKASILLYKAEIEKKISNTGYISMFYEDNLAAGFRSVNLSIKYDLNFAQTTASTRIGNNEISAFEGVRGSLMFGKNTGKVQASPGSNVGRGGVTIIPFIDINNNGIKENNERRVADLNVKINGGRMRYEKSDTVINVSGLEPFIKYTIELSDRDFENISWRIMKYRYEIVVDPNQFKVIEVPVVPVGEVSGMINLKSDSISRGFGRILINLFDIKGNKVAETISEQDGYWSFLGLTPGEYYTVIDTLQMKRLGYTVYPARRPVIVDILEEGDIITDISFDLSGGKLAVNKPDTANSGKKEVKEFYEKALKENADLAIIRGTDSGDDLYYIQAGAFETYDAARTVSKRMKKTINIASAVVKEMDMQKYRIGYFSNRKDAVAILDNLKTKGVGAFIGKGKRFVYKGNLDPGKGSHYVQTGAFRTEEYALSYLRIISGLVEVPAGIIIEDGYYKVRIGYFKTAGEASTVNKLIRSKGLESFRSGEKHYKE